MNRKSKVIIFLGLAAICVTFVLILLTSKSSIEKPQLSEKHNRINESKIPGMALSEPNFLNEKSVGKIKAEHPAVTTDPAFDGIIEESLSRMSNKALNLIEVLPPETYANITDGIDGPEVIEPAYIYKKGDSYIVNTHMLSENIDMETETAEWVNFGSTRVEIKEVSSETGNATIYAEKITSSEMKVEEINYKVPLEFSSRSFEKTLDGRDVSDQVVEVETMGAQIKITINSDGTNQLIFPGNQVKVGDSWKIKNDEDADQKQIFTFEGYSLVDGRKCMKISTDSLVNEKIDMESESHAGNSLRVISTKRITGVYYFDYELGRCQRTDLTTEVVDISCDNEQVESMLKNREGMKISRVIKNIKTQS